jgi:hypothetical protein
MKRLLFVLLGVWLLQGVVSAQNPPPPPPAKPAAPGKPAPPPPPPAPPAPARAEVTGNTRNIRLELRITDTYSGAPVEKTVSMIIRDGHGGRIRTTAMVQFSPEAVLNVDAITSATSDGSYISAIVTIEYRPAPSAKPTSGPTVPSPELMESVNVMLPNGKPLIVSQSADPASDRKVTLELTGTILK